MYIYTYTNMQVRHCRQHAQVGEADLIHIAKCRHAGCQKTPSFGIAGGQPIYCKRHRRALDTGLVGYRCLYIYTCIYTYIYMYICKYTHISALETGLVGYRCL